MGWPERRQRDRQEHHFRKLLRDRSPKSSDHWPSMQRPIVFLSLMGLMHQIASVIWPMLQSAHSSLRTRSFKTSYSKSGWALIINHGLFWLFLLVALPVPEVKLSSRLCRARLMGVAPTLSSRILAFREIMFYHSKQYNAHWVNRSTKGTASYTCQNVNITGDAASLFPQCTITWTYYGRINRICILIRAYSQVAKM